MAIETPAVIIIMQKADKKKHLIEEAPAKQDGRVISAKCPEV